MIKKDKYEKYTREELVDKLRNPEKEKIRTCLG